MRKFAGVAIVGAAMAAMMLGCSQGPSATASVIEDKSYTVTPASISVKAGILTGEVTEMKVTERVEKGSDRVVSPAKLTGKLVLKNSSKDMTVRLVGGKIQYLDAQGQPIKLEAARTEPTLKFNAYGSEMLDPGKESTQTVDVEFPAEALKAKMLKEIRLEPCTFRRHTKRNRPSSSCRSAASKPGGSAQGAWGSSSDGSRAPWPQPDPIPTPSHRWAASGSARMCTSWFPRVWRLRNDPVARTGPLTTRIRVWSTFSCCFSSR